MINAKPVIHARHRVTLVDLEGAILSGKPWLASADKVVDRVVTSSAVLARIGQAVVHIGFAQAADETC